LLEKNWGEISPVDKPKKRGKPSWPPSFLAYFFLNCVTPEI
jgi:hypothetical protein